jgi:hypothetical protein
MIVIRMLEYFSNNGIPITYKNNFLAKNACLEINILLSKTHNFVQK